MPFCFAAEMSLTYDANGNLISGDGKFRTYNSLNQLWRVYNGSNTSLLLEEYTYDPVEERVLIKKSYNTTGTLTETVVYVDQSFVQIKNLTGIFNYTYVYHDGTLVAQVNPDGTKYYIHSDSKGSNTIITNSSAKIIENSSYAPFGDTISITNKSRYGYEGKEFDSKVGDIDFNARKYNPTAGQFLQADSLIQNVYDPQGQNRYSFERNNPYKNIDPTGHDIFGISLGPDPIKSITDFFSSASDYVSSNFQSTIIGPLQNAAADVADWGATTYKYVSGGGEKSGVSNQEMCQATINGAVGAAELTLFLGFAGSSFSSKSGATFEGQSSMIGQRDSITFDTRQIQHEYKHAGDFGISGNYNKQNGELFKSALQDLIASPETKIKPGTYRGTIEGTHYFDPNTNKWVFVDSSGEYVASWELGPSQVVDLTKNSNVR